MKIACLGWGSLIWRPEALKIQGKWFEDGPILPIEFTRQSKDGRMTLIIDGQAKPVRVLWALMSVVKLDEAIESLQLREGVPKSDSIHSVLATDIPQDVTKAEIVSWLRSLRLDAAIWTGLSYSKATRNERPSADEVVAYLRNLDYTTQKNAAEYIRKAPKQIDTEYRRVIEQELGWICVA